MTAVDVAAIPSGVAAPADEPDPDLIPCARCRETGVDPWDFDICPDCDGRRYRLAPDSEDPA